MEQQNASEWDSTDGPLQAKIDDLMAATASSLRRFPPVEDVLVDADVGEVTLLVYGETPLHELTELLSALVGEWTLANVEDDGSLFTRVTLRSTSWERWNDRLIDGAVGPVVYGEFSHELSHEFDDDQAALRAKSMLRSGRITPDIRVMRP